MNNFSICLAINAIILCLFLAGCGETWDGKGHYGRIKGQWAWVASNVNGRNDVVLHVDAKSFVILEDAQYGKDYSRVFFRGRPILEADPASFVILPTVVGPSGRLFAKDRYHVFLTGFQVTGADPNSFEVIHASFGRDCNRVYCGTVPMPDADPATFRLTHVASGWGTMTNKEFFLEYYGPSFATLEISEDHPAITSNGTWSKDAKHHYYNAAPVEGADYDTFRPIDNWLGRDKNHEYHGRLRKEDFEREAELRAKAAKARAEERPRK